MSSYSTGPPFNYPGPGESEYKGAKLLEWRTGLARVRQASGLATVIFNGDSVTQGFTASTIANAYAARVVSNLATELGVTPSVYVPASANSSYTGQAPVCAPGALSEVNDSGLCGEAAYIPPGSTLTFPAITCTRLWLHAQRAPGIGGSFTYTVDGGAVQGPVGPAGGPNRLGGRIWDHGALASAAHTVVVTPDAIFGSVIEGISYHPGTGNTAGAQGFITAVNAQTGVGLRTYRAGHLGYSTNQYVFPGFSDPSSVSPLSTARFTDPWEFLQPDLSTWFLGINDNTIGNNANTYINRIAAIDAQATSHANTFAYTKPSMFFIAPYGIVFGDQVGYLNNMRALRSFCNVNGYGFLDLTELIGLITGNTGLSPDNIHLTDVGHRLVANYLSQVLLDG